MIVSLFSYLHLLIFIYIIDDVNDISFVMSFATLCLLHCGCIQVTDLHRHNIDHITIPSGRGSEYGVLRRVEDVSLF